MNKYTTILSIPNLDELTVKDAKSLFLEYKRRRVIVRGDFEDDKWFMSDEYKNVNLDFTIADYEPIKSIVGLSKEEFTDYFKAYLVFLMGELGLFSLQTLTNSIKNAAGNNDVLLLNRVIEFFSLLPAETDDFLDKLEMMEDEQILRPKSQRKLASFWSYFLFDDILKRFWNESKDTDERLFYFPVYMWWHITGIIPTRPKEFLVTPRNCLTYSNNKWMLTLRKDKLKGRNRKTSYKIENDFYTERYEISEDIALYIQWYIDETEDFIPTELDTLFRTDSHYSKWERSKPYTSRYYTYANLSTALRYFYKYIIEERYGYNIVFDAKDLKENDIEYLSLGDTRHLTMINAIAEGATPMVAMMLAGHDNPDMSSHYYTNITNLIECKTYRMYKKMLNGHESFTLSKMQKPLQVTDYVEIDGGRCYSPAVNDGNYTDCFKAAGPTGEIGFCNKCTYFRATGDKFSISREKYANDIETDCKNLDEIVKRVRKNKGEPEEILQALMRLRESEYSYEQYLQEIGYGKDNK